MTDRPSQNPFTPRQWADIVILIVLVWVQVILGLTWGKDHPVPLLLFGLVVLAIMIQVGRWLIPMARERRRNRR